MAQRHHQPRPFLICPSVLDLRPQTRQSERVSLESPDRTAIERLKYLRKQSMRNPAWRDADYLRLYITRRYMRWADDSPLEPFRVRVLASLKAFRRARNNGGDVDA